ncbi:transporter [Prolixibacter bellariivorans]|uniref:Transporter n=1 Tax=Prolixibacter bellariivorans TaxID=314319 RepID=A0A5M4AY32_9BACT|nr:TolC family protein [Prolixibacter bellariivorans]GET32533.1 transporter [Prolixibacter bellariivorans]
MSRLIYAIAFLILVSISNILKAQDTPNAWSLKECIDYAIKNNIQVKQGELSTQLQENSLRKAKADRYPNLTSQASQNESYGRSLTYSNTYENINSSQTNFNLSTNVPVFAGMQINNNIKAKNFDLKASMEDLQKVKDNITMNIASAYLEILFSQELVKVSEEQLAVTKQQIQQTQEKVDAGALAKGSLLDIQAQAAKEELTLVDNQNQLKLNYLKLAQLLELDSYKNFDIQKPELPTIRAEASLMSATEVYKNALALWPDIKSTEYKLQSSEYQLKAAKGTNYPTVSLYGNYFNLYNNKYTDTQGNEISFKDQLKNNERKGFGLQMDIPIFNRLQNKTQIDNAKINVLSKQLDVENAKKALRKDIETAETNAIAALNRYTSNQKAVAAMQEAFRYSEEKYNVGLVNALEYNQAKNNLAKAQSDLLQAKYEFIFRTKILDFYRGIPIEL